MGFDEYQMKANTTDLGRETLPVVMRSRNMMSAEFLDKVLGLSGEAGEVSEKVKKILRDRGGNFDESDREAIAKELGDVLWYVANVALYLEIPLSTVASMNIAKLSDRARRGKIGGKGDDR